MILGYSLRRSKLLVAISILLIGINLHGQDAAFQNEINAFKQADRAVPPAKGQILFVGSSSFRLWHDLQKDFPDVSVLNRGFGGSNLLDVIRYAQDIITPYQAKQVVIYCGENDLAGDTTLSAKDVFKRFKRLVHLIRQDKSDLPIVFVSLKPSPSRFHLIHKIIEANSRIAHYCSKHKKMSFANVYDPMLDTEFQPRPELFLEDKLHMTPAGYKIWKDVIEPYLIK